MSSILIGSSNLNHFYSPETFPTYLPYTMVKWVNMATNRARMACIDVKEKKVIIPAIENFIADCVMEKERITDEFRVVDRESFGGAIKETIETYMGVLRRSAEKFPDTDLQWSPQFYAPGISDILSIL
jgi:hypothetical protein